jgi:hypothetical protein
MLVGWSPLFAIVENRSYPDFWAITGDPWYLGYKTLIITIVTTHVVRCYNATDVT